MITQLGAAKLRSGERMSMTDASPPDAQCSDKLLAFYSHKPPEWLRDISRQLRGEFNAVCAAHFHFGTVAGEIVGGVWIGTPRGRVKWGCSVRCSHLKSTVKKASAVS
jgi:hypothetical protein